MNIIEFIPPHQAEELPCYSITRQARPGLWERIGGGALTFAIGLAAVTLVVLAVWYFNLPAAAPPPKDFVTPGNGGSARGATAKIEQKRQQMIADTQAKRVVAANTTGTFTALEGEKFGVLTDLPQIGGGGTLGGLGGTGHGRGFGHGDGNERGFGNHPGTGTLFGPLPPDWNKRCSKSDRLERITATGGTAACEDAVVKGLGWLKARQQPDGSWPGQSKTAMTGLALLAYFGHCETPASRDFGVSCLNGITYLVNIGMKNNGRMADNFGTKHWCYEHAIATYALAEAATFCKEIKQDVPGLMDTVRNAGQFIIDNQTPQGGWEYAYSEVSTRNGGDMSITGWQVQALKACSHTNLKFRGMATCIARSMNYIDTCQNENGGYGYAGPGASTPYLTLTGVGMLCQQMWGKGPSAVRKAGKYVMANTRFDYQSECADLYGHYYESQAMMQLGGDYWRKYNAIFRDQLLQNQNADGSWKVPGGGKQLRAVAPSYTTDEVYRTCLCTLMLEVYYRFLSTGGETRGHPSMR